MRIQFWHLYRRWNLIWVIIGYEGPKCGRFSSVGDLNQIDRTFILGVKGPEIPKIGQN